MTDEFLAERLKACEAAINLNSPLRWCDEERDYILEIQRLRSQGCPEIVHPGAIPSEGEWALACIRNRQVFYGPDGPASDQEAYEMAIKALQLEVERLHEVREDRDRLRIRVDSLTDRCARLHESGEELERDNARLRIVVAGLNAELAEMKP